jgi:hypothetical protein
MIATVPAARLAKLSTPALIEQYDLAVLKRGFARAFNANGVPTPRQQRVNRIVEILGQRAEQNDAVADAWLRAN